MSTSKYDNEQLQPKDLLEENNKNSERPKNSSDIKNNQENVKDLIIQKKKQQGKSNANNLNYLKLRDNKMSVDELKNENNADNMEGNNNVEEFTDLSAVAQEYDNYIANLRKNLQEIKESRKKSEIEAKIIKKRLNLLQGQEKTAILQYDSVKQRIEKILSNRTKAEEKMRDTIINKKQHMNGFSDNSINNFNTIYNTLNKSSCNNCSNLNKKLRKAYSSTSTKNPRDPYQNLNNTQELNVNGKYRPESPSYLFNNKNLNNSELTSSQKNNKNIGLNQPNQYNQYNQYNQFNNNNNNINVNRGNNSFANSHNIRDYNNYMNHNVSNLSGVNNSYTINQNAKLKNDEKEKLKQELINNLKNDEIEKKRIRDEINKIELEQINLINNFKNNKEFIILLNNQNENKQINDNINNNKSLQPNKNYTNSINSSNYKNYENYNYDNYDNNDLPDNYDGCENLNEDDLYKMEN